MRALSSELLAAQKSGSVTPYVKVVLTQPVSPYTVYTFDNVGYDGALLRVNEIVQYQEPWGGLTSIRLRNFDKYFGDKDLKGWKVELYWGAKISTGYEGCLDSPLFVWNQRDMSSGGVLYTELDCLDMWWQIAFNETIRAGERIEGEATSPSSFTIGEVITSSPAGATGILVGVSSDSILVTAVSGTFDGKDYAYGASASVTCDTVTIVVAASGAAAAKDTVIKDLIASIMPTSITDVVVDEDDPDSTVTTYCPLLVTQVGESARGITRQLLQMSKCGARIGNDSKLHILYLDQTDVANYEYYNDHSHWTQLRERAVIMPNSVLFVDAMPDDLGNYPAYSGTSKDQNSVDLIGEFSTIQVNPSIEYNGDVPGGAERFAKNWIHQRLAEAYQGEGRAPMNCGQELYDMVQIVDDRSGLTIKARVGRIDRIYRPGVYEIKLRLGGVMSEFGALPGSNPDTDIRDTSPGTDAIGFRKNPLDIEWDKILPKAIQGYHHDITFSATDWDTVAWTSGTIKFYDGTEQAISSGNFDMPDGQIYYIYFDLDDASPNVLKTTTSYTSVMDLKTGLVCLVQRGSSTGILCTVIPSYGKEPLITADFIDMTGIKNYTYPDGTHVQSLLNTQIQAGHILLSAETYYASETYNIAGKEVQIVRSDTAPTDTTKLWWDTTLKVMKRYDGAAWTTMAGEWYNKTGILIDATKGIRAYGTNMAFATFADETNARAGTNYQVKMDSNGYLVAGAGAIYINSNGILVSGASACIFIYDTPGGTQIGGIGYNSTNTAVAIWANTGKLIYIVSNTTIILSASQIDIGGALVPQVANSYYLGSAIYPWGYTYSANVIVTTSLTIPASAS